MSEVTNQDIKKMRGRPSVMTKDVKDKLVEAFLIGCSDREACVWANICPTTLYNYQKVNPEYIENKNSWKMQPILKAKMVIYQSLSNPDFAWKYLCKHTSSFQTKSGT